MALQFVVGSSGSGKSRFLYEEVLSQASENPDKRYIVLVPEQSTLQAQKDLVGLSAVGGILNIDVLSFTRLAYRVFEQTGVKKRAYLTETGKSLLLRLIAAREESGLSLLKGALDRPGYIQRLKSMLSELDQYAVTAEDLGEMAVKAGREGHPSLQKKLSDLSALMDACERWQADRFTTPEKLLSVVCEKADEAPMLQGAQLYLDGFTGFTPPQLTLIEKILSLGGDITLTVTIDPHQKNIWAGEIAEHELFAMSKKTIRSLLQTAQRAGADVPEPVVLDGKGRRFKEGSELEYLERHLLRFGKAQPYRTRTGTAAALDHAGTSAGNSAASDAPADGDRAAAAGAAAHQIVLRRCRTIYEEILSAAVTITALTRDGGMHYRDIALVCGDLTSSSEYVRKIFSEYEIPYFIDRTVPVVLNAAFEFVRAAFSVLDLNFSYESVMALIRTGFVFTDESSDADILENYLLACGIRGRKAWEGPFARMPRKEDPALLERAEIMRASFMDRFSEFADTARPSRAPLTDYVKAVRSLLSAFCVSDLLEKQADEAAETGDFERENTARNVIAEIERILEEAEGLIGEEKVSREQFEEMLRAGFEEARIGMIPPGIDQVSVGDLERTRLNAVRAVLFVGVNDANVPARRRGGGILTDSEREYLRAGSLNLAPGGKEDQNIQQFYMYLTLTKPDELLVLSWSVADRSGEAMQPSWLITKVRELFPEIPVESGAEEGSLAAVVNTSGAVHTFSGMLQDVLSGEEEDPEAEARLHEVIKAAGEDPEKLRAVADAVRGQWEEAAISRASAELLYGRQMEGSVTRLEEFALCPFRHFADYGLGLKEREEFQLTGADTGNLLHSSMELLAKKVAESDAYTWGTVPDEVLVRWAGECVESVAGAVPSRVYSDSARNAALLQRMKHMLIRSARTMKKQLGAGEFYPAAFEVFFRSEGNLSALSVDMGDGRSMELRGRIDRVDLSKDEESGIVYVKIVDYKSGDSRISLDKLMEGSQLQLLLYLDAAARLQEKIDAGSRIVCAGVFYSQFQDPLLEAKEAEGGEEAAVLKKMRPHGIINSDPEVIRRMDAALLEKSLMIPSDRGLKLSGRQIDLLRDYTRVKTSELASSILSGRIAPSPLRESSTLSACTWCDYADVCRFDPSAWGMSYRDIRKLDDEERWTKMKEAVESEDSGAASARSGQDEGGPGSDGITADAADTDNIRRREDELDG